MNLLQHMPIKNSAPLYLPLTGMGPREGMLITGPDWDFLIFFFQGSIARATGVNRCWQMRRERLIPNPMMASANLTNGFLPTILHVALPMRSVKTDVPSSNQADRVEQAGLNRNKLTLGAIHQP